MYIRKAINARAISKFRALSLIGRVSNCQLEVFQFESVRARILKKISKIKKNVC